MLQTHDSESKKIIRTFTTPKIKGMLQTLSQNPGWKRSPSRTSVTCKVSKHSLEMSEITRHVKKMGRNSQNQEKKAEQESIKY